MDSREQKKHKKGFRLGPKKQSSLRTRTHESKKIVKKNNKRKKKALNEEKTENHFRNDEKDSKEVKGEKKVAKRRRNGSEKEEGTQHPTAAEQLNYFLHEYQSANRIRLSDIELEFYKDAYMLELCLDKTAQTKLDKCVKIAFGSSWKEVLCEKELKERKVDPGNPALLVISSSALRSLELLRELRPLTIECHAAKLFSKHMKIEEQVSFLKNRVNIACGTPNRIKKLIDMEALGMSRLAVIVLDMHTDVKGYSLFTLPQVREEFWDLYESHFQERLLKGDLRIYLYGKLPAVPKAATEAADDDLMDYSSPRD